MPKKTIEIEAENSIELDAKERILKNCATIPMEDLERVGQLVTNPNALAGLKKHWIMLRTMFR
ncbi:hypothetical protein [Flavobacterium sp. AG291]|uniref:hypothetical protein n=1 Tax=Flavobacterium sp. AG291 TaxID=2184000 RepID=UPI000E0A6A9A|nr:hypothetical protein [Flavobacterium sp. AG291]RDI07045.1 hypothetical protein DEU42_113145 [Flavobacterium sp. AG291]